MNKERLYLAIKETAVISGKAFALAMAFILFAVVLFWLIEHSLVIGAAAGILSMFIFLVWIRYKHGI